VDYSAVNVMKKGELGELSARKTKARQNHSKVNKSKIKP